MKNTRENEMANEQYMADWFLTHRLLNEVGQLERHKVDFLNKEARGWARPVTDDEAAHAIIVDNPELNNALETWWNHQELPGTPITFKEIRVKSAMEA